MLAVELVTPDRRENDVTRKFADMGDLATPGRPLLELDNPKALRLEADVPESLINRVQLGTSLSVHSASETGEGADASDSGATRVRSSVARSAGREPSGLGRFMTSSLHFA